MGVSHAFRVSDVGTSRSIPPKSCNACGTNTIHTDMWLPSSFNNVSGEVYAHRNCAPFASGTTSIVQFKTYVIKGITTSALSVAYQ